MVMLCTCSATELRSQNTHHLLTIRFVVYLLVLIMTLTRLTWSMTWVTVEKVKNPVYNRYTFWQEGIKADSLPSQPASSLMVLCLLQKTALALSTLPLHTSALRSVYPASLQLNFDTDCCGVPCLWHPPQSHSTHLAHSGIYKGIDLKEQRRMDRESVSVRNNQRSKTNKRLFKAREKKATQNN